MAAQIDMDTAMQAWFVKDEDFPHEGSAADKLAFCIHYAVLAHSTYNTQPWFFRIKDKTAYIHVDRRYALPVIDPDDREAVMACAGAMFHLRLAIRHFGYKETTDIAPDAKDASLIGQVTIGGRTDSESEADPLDTSLFEAIPTRHSNFAAFSDKEVQPDILKKLQVAAEKEGAWLHICNDYERTNLSHLVIEGDHIQMSDKRFRRELAAWLDPRRMLSGDGMPQRELDFQKMTASYGISTIRRFETEDRSPVSDDMLQNEIPVMAILGCRNGGLVERVYAGQALARVLLRAEAEGLSVSTLNQPCEVPELRLRLHDEIPQTGRAQAILRIGYGGKPTRTPRRAVEQVLEIEGKSAKSASLGNVANDKREKSGFFGRFARLFVAKS